MPGLLFQLVEHCTGIAEVMGSNPVQAWIFFIHPFQVLEFSNSFFDVHRYQASFRVFAFL